MNKKSPRFLVFVVIAIVMTGFRFGYFEPVGRSVSTYDTQGFVLSSEIPLLSPNFFISGRPATIALFYKLMEPSSGYQLTNFSSPAEDQQQPLLDQPSFRGISTAQSMLAMLAWFLLAFVVFRRITNAFLGGLAEILILLFAFTPPLAEWDYVLLSEPLSLTLFVFLFALSIELAARPREEWARLSRGTIALFAAWLLVLVLWIFSRDTNAYLLIPVIGLLTMFLVPLWRHLRPLFPVKGLGFVVIVLALLFVVQSATAQTSGRWINPFFNNMLHRVFPYPQRLAFFENKGMPITDEVLALRQSPGNEDGFFEIDYLMDWVGQHGARTYIEFLVNDPAWTWAVFSDGVNSSFSENRQPFFVSSVEITPDSFSHLGDLLHPNSTSVFLVVLIEMSIFGLLSLRSMRQDLLPLFIVFVVFFCGELLMLFVSIEGDALGIVRHALGSVVPLRLFVWLLPPFILDALVPKTR